MTTIAAEKPLDLSLVHGATDPKEKLRAARAVIEAAEGQMEPRRLRRNAAALLLYRRANAVAMARGLPFAEWPMQPAAMWRDTLDVSRSLWHKILDEADTGRLAELQGELAAAEEEIEQLPEERAAELIRLNRERDKLRRRVARHVAQVRAVEALQAELDAHPELDLLAVAREETAEARRLEKLIAAAKPIRNKLAHDLMNGAYRAQYGTISNAEAMKLSGLSSARTTQLRALR